MAGERMAPYTRVAGIPSRRFPIGPGLIAPSWRATRIDPVQILKLG